MKCLSICLLIMLAGCAARSTYNIIDITDEQWIEDKDGNLCIDKEMIITPTEIEYYYSNCAIRRVVKPKPHILPKPLPAPQCTGRVCIP